MQFFRLLHRQTKSEGDVPTLLSQLGSTGITTPVFVPLQQSLPPFDPAQELYGSPTNSVYSPTSQDHIAKLNARISELEKQQSRLHDERATLEHDLADYRADLLHARTELYSEMLHNARHQQHAVDNFRTIQRLEVRYQRFYSLLVDIGIPRTTVDVICQVIQSGNGSAKDILVDAIQDASRDNSTLLARLKPIVTNERTPDRYQSALNLTLSIRRELKSQKKKSKFWKKLAREHEPHASTITPSPSDMSSIHQDLSPERQRAVDALIARRRAVRYPEHTDSDVFGGQRGESALDSLASSLASRPRRSIPDDLRLSSSFSSSASSASTHVSYLSAISRVAKDSVVETPTIPTRLPSTLSTSLRRSSRSSSQSIVLGSVDLNISRSSPIDPILLEETEGDAENGPASTVTLSQDLLQNDRRVSQGHRHRRATSRRSAPTNANRSSFRLSAFSSIEMRRTTGPLGVAELDVSGNTAVHAPLFDAPGVVLRLSDLTTNAEADTPGPSEDTPFNDTRVLPKYDATPFSSAELETRIASTPLDDGSVAGTCTHAMRFLEHSDSSISTAMSVSTVASEASAHAHDDGQEGERDDNHRRTDANTGTISLGESNDSLFTASASASVTSSITANDTPAPATPPTPSRNSNSIPVSSPTFGETPSSAAGIDMRSGGGAFASVKRSMLPVLAKHLRRFSFSGTPSPERERLMSRLRALRSLSRSRSKSQPGLRSGSGSPARPELGRSGGLTASLSPSPSPSPSPSSSPSPVKGSGIPVLQRRMTIRARRTSVKKI